MTQHSSEYQCKSIKGFPGYKIDTEGRIFSYFAYPGYGGGVKINNKLKERKSNIVYAGYRQICLFNNGKRFYKLIHRLILETFIGPCPKGMEACHKNDIKTDNYLSNLRWGTKKENYVDAVKNGKRGIGEKGANAKLKNTDISLIWELLKNSHLTQKRIGELFGVSKTVISDIFRHKNWNYVS